MGIRTNFACGICFASFSAAGIGLAPHKTLHAAHRSAQNEAKVIDAHAFEQHLVA
jgi:hypothetical protein